MNRKKPRGLRIKKPILPRKFEIGNVITYEEWRGKTHEVEGAIVEGEPIWSNDGFWEMDIKIKVEDAQLENRNELGGYVYHQVLWDEDKKKWISGEL